MLQLLLIASAFVAAQTFRIPAALGCGHAPSLLSRSCAPRLKAEPLSGVSSFVQSLYDGGASRAEIETAFHEAIAAIQETPLASPPAEPPKGLSMPATVTDAKQAFRDKYSGGAKLTTYTLKFVNSMITTSFIYKFKYSRVFAVGLMGLCDTFLAKCADEKDAADVRDSLCVALGLDGDMVKRDAEALLALAAGMTEAELLATDDFATIASTERFKYTCELPAVEQMAPCCARAEENPEMASETRITRL